MAITNNEAVGATPRLLKEKTKTNKISDFIARTINTVKDALNPLLHTEDFADEGLFRRDPPPKP